MFARHDLAWLTGRGWQHARAAAPADCIEAIDRWQQKGWPAVVRRADIDLPANQLSLGIALPPRSVDGGKRRIACRVPAAEVRMHAPPLPLAQAIDAAPQAWRPLLAALERQAAVHGLAIRVYGSVALQALTGQTYLTAASDIDLLLHPATPAQLYSGLDLLNSYAGKLPLDGEIVFPNAQAVAWKELSGALGGAAGTRVLVKQMQAVALATTDDLLATMKDGVCTSR
jgi:phosphoribosyl-dephospho-CoA transferase